MSLGKRAEIVVKCNLFFFHGKVCDVIHGYNDAEIFAKLWIAHVCGGDRTRYHPLPGANAFIITTDVYYSYSLTGFNADLCSSDQFRRLVIAASTYETRVRERRNERRALVRFYVRRRISLTPVWNWKIYVNSKIK